jgi:hypothetical protein
MRELFPELLERGRGSWGAAQATVSDRRWWLGSMISE